ncbi:uncharacterized protein LOC116847228 [Odontomachus brunneus]|uniref:uncharacterized protein LOC116847228 n=1 Tax=Odontomachus brunneus TaxID=486640 RepID=UPI0013F19E55|nr:uncharacterized protein LOC116847228 [Odontomachus brunneus]
MLVVRSSLSWTITMSSKRNQCKRKQHVAQARPKQTPTQRILSRRDAHVSENHRATVAFAESESAATSLLSARKAETTQNRNALFSLLLALLSLLPPSRVQCNPVKKQFCQVFWDYIITKMQLL